MATPLCRHFGPCGGCDWQDLTYTEQLSRKRRRLEDLLAHALGARAPQVRDVVGMPVDSTGWPWRFRQKASFVFGPGPDGRTPIIGHYAARSNDVVATSECPVHADRANRLAFALHEHLARAQVPAAGTSLRGLLRHVIIRTTRDAREIAALLVVTRNDKALRRPIKAFLETEEAPDSFYLGIHDRPGPYMIGEQSMRLAGRSHVKETVNGLAYLLSPTAFFQTNVDAAEIIVRQMLETVASDAGPQRVLDLYSGGGLFAVALAARGHLVTAVEENRQAMEDAEATLRFNRLGDAQIRLHARRVEEALPRLVKEPFETVILDPPRQGCSPEVLHHVFGRSLARRVVYVSCNPDALAAELPGIVDCGWTIDRVQPVDMFPHTTHIETVVTFSRRSARRTRASAPARRDSPTRPARRH